MQKVQSDTIGTVNNSGMQGADITFAHRRSKLTVAEEDGQIVGAVAYLGPGVEKAVFFHTEWPIMRMLVVDTKARGRGIGRRLAQGCIDRARRDGATIFALHTSELMNVALPMYERMGFKWVLSTPDIRGVQYGLYVKEL